MKVPWCEYWEFLNAVVDIESAEGLQQFEMYLRKRLRELIERRAAEQEHERLQNTSVCQLMQLLNLSDSSLRHSSLLETSSNQHSGILPDVEVQRAVCTTWPPSLVKLLSHSDEVKENSPSEELQQLADEEQLNGSHKTDSDTVSACSADSFHTAGDDSDIEFNLASDWPDDFDWQAVEPLFIYG